MARYIGNIPYRNPDEEAYNFRTRPYTSSTDMTLDGSNQTTALTYGDVRLSSITYDALYRISSFVETIGSTSYTITFNYDGSGNLTSVTRA